MSDEVDGLTNKLVYNTNTVNCQWNDERTIGNLCYPTYQLSTIQDSSCPTGLELSQTECEPAATSLGLDYSSFQVSSWLHLPCGCSYMSEAVDGLTNKLVYNTNTVNCQWETRTIGNVCEFQRPYYELVSQIHCVHLLDIYFLVINLVFEFSHKSISVLFISYSTSRRGTHSTPLVDVQVGMNWVVQVVRFKSVQIVVMPMPLVFHLSIPRQELSAASQQVVTTLALP